MVFSPTALEQGSPLAILGYPLGTFDLRISEGIVSGLNDTVDYPEFSVGNVFTTDAATNGGNSGGPVVNRQGEVIGLVSGGQDWDGVGESLRPVQGINYMVPSNELQPNFNQWKNLPVAGAAECQGETGPPADDVRLNVTIESDQEDAPDIAQSLALHGQGINTGSYASAWTIFTPKMKRDMGSLEKWQQGLASSYWTDLVVTKVTREGDTAEADAQLRTQQRAEDGRNGQTCSDWSFTYTMRLIDGVWRIDRAHAEDGSPTKC